MPQSIVQPLRRWDPERIGPYAIIGKLGAGAMGQVFLARSAAGRLVAVKTIRVELAEEPGFRARFAREVAAASRVSGVFTAAVIEADPDADLPWVATAYIPAPSLSTLVRQAGPLPVPAVRWLAAGCAEALQSIHAAGLLHRDVKPSNVLVAPDGPRVIDFGLARAAERVQLTATRGASGTPAYMAPEQARDATQASPASDVFSLGATLVYAATGHAPYQGDTVMDILVRLATEPPDLAGVPAELIGLVTACLERVPRMRPSSTAIVGQLGPFAQPTGSGRLLSLPDSAMAVIAGYARASLPQATERQSQATEGQSQATDRPPWDTEDDQHPADDGTAGSAVAIGRSLPGHSTAGTGTPGTGTAGSHTALPGFHSPDSYAARHGAGPQAPGPAADDRRGRRALPLWSLVAVAVVLLAAGTAIGVVLRGGATPSGPLAGAPTSGTAAASGHQSAGPTPGASKSAARTSGTQTSRVKTSSSRTSGSQASSTLGPVTPPPSACTGQSQSGPQLCISQPFGDGDTVFIIHGVGFSPGSRVTVTLAGVGSSPDHPVADGAGMFNYAVDQGHVFFSGEIPSGTYHVLAKDAAGGDASASFRVFPPGQVPLPGGGA
jgi:serine/threonine protein kinase